MKQTGMTGMLVVSLRGVNFGFWSRLGCSGQSATLPKGVYCYRYCFLETKDRMHNEVGTCAEILPRSPVVFFGPTLVP